MAIANELSINTSATALDMANAIFGNGIVVTGATYSGAAMSSGIYSGATTTIPGITSSNTGVILSTGNVADFTNSSGSTNTNVSNGTSTDTTGVDGDAQLNAVAGMATFDGAILQATFIPDGNYLTMQFVFTSEEYPEYVNGNVNDSFGVWVNGNFVPVSISVAGNVAIDEVNGGKNENLYRDNMSDQFNTEMDGITYVLSLKAPVNSGQVNTIKIGIADGGDAVFDSNLLIMGESVQTVALAMDDDLNVVANSNRTFDILANDRQSAGAGLTITQINGTNVVAGQTVTLLSGQQVRLNADGTVTVFANGTIGQENFTYTVSDGTNTDVGYVSINTASAAVLDGIVSGTSGNDVIGGAYVGDPDGDRVDNNDATGVMGTTGDADLIYAGAGNDSITAGAGNDIAYGGAGNDTALGGAGNDTLYGDAGDDSLLGGDGVDSLYGGLGNDTLTAGSGNDQIFAGAGNDSVGGWSVDDSGDDTIYGEAGNDSIIAGAGNDVVYGGTADDMLSGQTGNDTLYGGDGQDIFVITDDHEGDTIEGGEGGVDFDTLELSNFLSTQGVTVTFAGSEAGTYDFNASPAMGSFSQIEHVHGTDYADTFNGTAATSALNVNGDLGNDTVIGGAAADSLSGDAGADVLNGGAGADTIFGGSDADRITGGAGDVITGGETTTTGGTDNDILIVEAGSVITYGGGTNEAGTIALASGGTLTFSEIESVVFAGPVDGTVGNDMMNVGYTDLNGDQIDGSDGDNDVIFGYAGNDSITAGNGDDSVYGGTGDDTIVGGDDEDTLSGDAGNDSLSGGNLTDMIYGGIGNDTLDGGEHTDTVYGGAGDDLIIDTGGSLSDDTLYGGDGNDTIDGGAREDSISGDAGDDRLTGDVGDDTLSGGDGADTIYGGADADSIDGGADADVIYGGSGDVVTGGEATTAGGSDNDTLYLTNVTNLTYGGGTNEAGTVTFAGGSTMTFTQIEHLVLNGGNPDGIIFGTADNDVIQAGYVDTNGDVIDNNDAILGNPGSNDDEVYAGAGDDTVRGLSGNDFLYGGDGNDSLDGGVGNDYIQGDAGNDTVVAGDGNDFVRGDAGNDIVYGGAGDDSTYGGAGNDFVYGGTGNDQVFGGFGDDTVYGGDGNDTLTGSGENDQVYGDDGDDFLQGSDGADTLFGGLGADTMLGEEDADIFYGGSGDYVDGYETVTIGTDNDTLHVAGVASVVWDTLNPENGTITFTAGGTLQFYNIENLFVDGAQVFPPNFIVEGTAGNDLIDASYVDGQGDRVDSSDNQVGTNDDLVYAGNGDDTILSGQGNDQVYAGAGFDSLDGGAGNDSLNGGEGNDTILGGAGDDTIVGWSGANALYGGDGNDEIYGGGGSGAGPRDDTIYGGAGDDMVTGDEGNDLVYLDEGDDRFGTYGTDSVGNDTVYGGLGNDMLIGGDNNDALFGDAGNDSLGGGLDDDSLYGGEGNDALLGEEGNDSLNGGTGNDSLVGGIGADALTGGLGADTLEGGDDQDTLFGAVGDSVQGGEGGLDNDTLVLNYADVASITYGGGNNEAGTVNFVAGGTLTFAEIENVTFAGPVDGTSGNDTMSSGYTDINGDIVDGADGLDDTILAAAGNDVVWAGLGDDLVYGGDGDDSLRGGSGNDTLYGGAGNDYLDTDLSGTGLVYGGDGADTIYASDDHGAEVLFGGEGGTDQDQLNLTASAGTNGGNVTFTGDESGTYSFGTATGTFAQIEAVVGSAYGDTINAAASNMQQTLSGADGNDVLTGGSADDQLYGGMGDDTLDGGANSDTLDGGTGDDAVLGGDGNDVVFGGDGSDLINAGTGDDAVYGGADADTILLQSPMGIDSIVGGETGADFDTIDMGGHVGAVSVTFTGDEAGSITAGGSGTATFSQIENLVLTAGNDTVDASADTAGIYVSDYGGNDSVLGGAGNDTVYSGDGDDTLAGGSGNDVLFGGNDQDVFVVADNYGTDQVSGGSGYDIIDLSALTGPVTVTLTGNGAGTVTNAGNVITFSSIEQIVLTDQADIVDASASTDGGIYFQGFGGNDTLTGGSGDDIFDDEAGLSNGQGNDIFYGGAGNDTLWMGTNDDVAYGGADNDSLQGQEGNDLLFGGAGDDLLAGSSGSDTFAGGTGNDILNLSSVPSDVDFVVLSDGDGQDTVDAFEAPIDNGDGTFTGKDQLDVSDLTDASGTPVNTADVIVTDDGSGNAVLTFPNGESVTLNGVSPSELATPAALVAIGIPAAPNLVVDGTAGDDAMAPGYVDLAGDIIDGADGDNDTIFGYAGNDTIQAGVGDDIAYGGIGDDEISGNSGNDDLIAGDGNDYVEGGDGQDTISGGNGNDALNGGTGNDLIYGGAGSDGFDGGDGNDTLYGGSDADDVRGGFGDDSLYGGDGNDRVLGGDGNDTLFGDAGTDTLEGSIGNDLIDGGDGNDSLSGGSGNDTLLGDLGNDTLDGGTGNDILTGGDGADSLIGADDRDTFFVGNGDSVDGGEGGDDYDVLDLSAYTHAGTNVIYNTGNPENGTVEFLDASGAVIGTMAFSNIENVIACFTPGAMIATGAGLVAVENLREGDLVLTRDNGYQPIRWVGRRDLSAADLLAEPRFNPVQICAGALGLNAPHQDMWVSPQHRMLIAGPRAELLFGENEVLVAATHMVGMPGIIRAEPDCVSYIHILFDQHEVVQADGSWTESFQPGVQTLGGLNAAQRDEIFALFPTLKDGESYDAARMTLKAKEARLLMSA